MRVVNLIALAIVGLFLLYSSGTLLLVLLRLATGQISGVRGLANLLGALLLELVLLVIAKRLWRGLRRNT